MQKFSVKQLSPIINKAITDWLKFFESHNIYYDHCQIFLKRHKIVFYGPVGMPNCAIGVSIDPVGDYEYCIKNQDEHFVEAVFQIDQKTYAELAKWHFKFKPRKKNSKPDIEFDLPPYKKPLI